jgi:hypothetical protein
LDYREEQYVDGQWVAEFPERNLADRLKHDADPFVRACLRENPHVPLDSEASLQDMPHMERLACMRNPDLGRRFTLINDRGIEKIFDPADQELGIDLEARKDLIRALLTNPAVVSVSQRLSPRNFDTGAETFDSLEWVVANGRAAVLWQLMVQWPRGHEDLQGLVYQYVGAPDETKAQIYQACHVPALKHAILLGCGTDDGQTLTLGMQDTDDFCRQLAYGKFDPRRFASQQAAEVLLQNIFRDRPSPPPIDTPTAAEGIHSAFAVASALLQAALEGEDKAALRGLAQNQTLPAPYLERVQSRLDELGAQHDAWEARQRLQEMREGQAPEDPEELFGEEGKRGAFLADKINVIGKQLLATDHELRRLARTLNRLIAGLIVAATGVGVLLLWRFS